MSQTDRAPRDDRTPLMSGGKFEMAGWGLFSFSGVLFLVAALRDGDALLLWGSITWLLGVALFLIGLRRRT